MAKRWAYSFKKRNFIEHDSSIVKYTTPISVIIPCYNEQRSISNTLDYVMGFLVEHFSDFEIIVISDGSSDRTVHIVEDIIRKNRWYNYVKLLDYDKNKGKGYAIRCGLVTAVNKLIMILDCDLSVKPENILIILPDLNLSKPFFIAGQRIQIVSQSKIRLFLGWGFRTFTRLFTGIKMKDSQCPYKVLNKINPKLFNQMKIDGFAYDVELIKLIQSNKIAIIEQPVEYYNDPNSTVTFKKVIRMAYDIIKL